MALRGGTWWQRKWIRESTPKWCCHGVCVKVEWIVSLQGKTADSRHARSGTMLLHHMKSYHICAHY
jgi:hypothetical protein